MGDLNELGLPRVVPGSLAHNDIRLLMEERTPIYKVAAFIQVTPEALRDVPMLADIVAEQMRISLRRMTHPWEFADRPVMPALTLFPAPIERLLAWFDSR